ncbi:MAG: hypothetical protein GY787_16175 [Alteromonadales bacterium]|nr:hypothetical protein [Alteromonadales bacterium]
MPASNIFQQFTQGQALAQQRGLRDQEAQLNEQRRQQNFLKLDEARRGALFQDAQAINTFLKGGDVNSAMGVISNRVNMLEQLGGDTSDTMEIANLIGSGNIQGARDLLDLTEQVGMQQGFLKDPDEQKTKDTRTATQKDFDTFQGLMAKAAESGSEKDKKRAERFGRAARFIRESEQEKADIKVSQKERETIAKANVARKQGFINSGIEAANGAANTRRALTLLDEVETGGFDNLALKAKRLFGVEGASEGELSNLMGKAVLAQLKPIFGAAFTAREGDALAEIEAKFSNSTANNKRLLENALKLIDRAARRGIAAAEDQKDEFTANEIREALSFELEDKNIPLQEPQQAIGGLSPEEQAELAQLEQEFGGQ